MLLLINVNYAQSQLLIEVKGKGYYYVCVTSEQERKPTRREETKFSLATFQTLAEGIARGKRERAQRTSSRESLGLLKFPTKF